MTATSIGPETDSLGFVTLSFKDSSSIRLFAKPAMSGMGSECMTFDKGVKCWFLVLKNHASVWSLRAASAMAASRASSIAPGHPHSFITEFAKVFRDSTVDSKTAPKASGATPKRNVSIMLVVANGWTIASAFGLMIWQSLSFLAKRSRSPRNP
ncbi:hypothetical protein D3C78_1361850 [compost metagenome]